MLERTEQSLRLADTAPRIAESNDNALLIYPGRDGQFAARLVQQSAFAVFRKVEKDLHQTLPIGPYHGKARLDFPL